MATNTKQLVLPTQSPAAEEDPCGVAFVDTTLGTRLLIPVSTSDTVSDFKRKIEKEHALYFSDIGEIVVHALKVKRRGQFYHLSDSMLVKHAFGLFTKNWFLSVDASVVEKSEKSNKRKSDKRRGNDLVDGFELTPGSSAKIDNCDDRNIGRECEKHGGLVEEALGRFVAEKKRQREVERTVVDGDLREDVGLGKDSSEPVTKSQPLLGDKERSEKLDVDDDRLVTESLGTGKRKKRKKSKSNQEFGGGPYPSEEFSLLSEGGTEKMPSESGGILMNQKRSDAIREAGTHIADKTEEETSALNKTEASKDHCPFGVENIQPSLVIVPEDVQMAEKQATLSKNGFSGMQLSNLDSTCQDETEARAKVVDGTGKKEKRRKMKGLVEKVLPKSLETKCDEHLDDKARNEDNDLSNGNEMVKENIESSFAAKEDDDIAIGNDMENPANKEEEPGRKKRKKKKKKSTEKQNSTAINLPDEQVEPPDANHQNLALQAVTKSELIASSNTKKGNKDQLDGGLVQSKSLEVQHAALAESKLVAAKSTKAQSHSHGHVDEADLADDIRPRTDETEDETCAPSKMETVKNRLSVNLESYLPPVMKEPEDLQMCVEASSNQDETEVKSKDVDMTTALVAENESAVSRDTGKKLRSKRTKGSVGDVLLAPLGAKFDKQPDGNEIPKENVESTFVAKENDGIAGNEEEPVKTKSKKKRKSTAKKNVSDVQEEPEDVNRQNPTVQAVAESEVLASSNTKKKRKVGAQLQDQPIKGKLESGNLVIQKNQMKVSELGNKSIPEQLLPSIAASSEVHLPNVKKKAKMHDTHSVQMSSSSDQSKVKSNGKQKITGKTPKVKSSTVIAPEALVEEKSDESMVRSEKQLPKASKDIEGKSDVNDTGKKLNSGKITDDALDASNSQLERPRNVNSQSAACNKGICRTEVIDSKESNNDNGGTMIMGLESKKKLIATPGSIFGDDSDGFSDDEGTDDSDDSTKAPSDYSSDYSDGEVSNANSKSPHKGALTSEETKTGDERNILKSCSSGGKDFTFDKLLRSSSRYKKAQLTASQSHHDYESQQVDRVPDSQPNQ